MTSKWFFVVHSNHKPLILFLFISFFFLSLYCWRTRRLLADRHLPLFQYMQDGNLGRGLRRLKNLPEPEPPVVVVATPVVTTTTTTEGGGEEEMKEEQPKGTEDKEGDNENEAKEMEIGTDNNSTTTTAAATAPPSVRAVDEEPEEGEEVEESASESNKMET
jgi:hypothetical protein